MTSRTGWFLLAAAVGLSALPGCFPWQTNRTSTEQVRKGDLPPPGELQARRPGADPPPHWPAGGTPGTVDFDPPWRNIEGAKPTVSGGPKPLAEGPLPDHKVSTEPPTVEPVAPPPVKPPEAKPEPIKLAPLVEALDHILNDRHQEALHCLQAYDRDTQEFYLRALPALTILARKRVEDLSAQEVAVLTDQLQSVLATLRPRTALAIDRMCYCEWVKAYGIYQPLPEGHAFVAPAGDRPGEVVCLYVEVRNFASVARSGSFETRLASTIEIRDAHGQKVQALDFKNGEKPLRSRTRLNDYYNTYTFLVPPLPAGVYQLVLEIADETNPQARRVARKTLELRVTPVGTRP